MNGAIFVRGVSEVGGDLADVGDVICCQGPCAMAANETRNRMANPMRILLVLFISNSLYHYFQSCRGAFRRAGTRLVRLSRHRSTGPSMPEAAGENLPLVLSSGRTPPPGPLRAKAEPGGPWGAGAALAGPPRPPRPPDVAGAALAGAVPPPPRPAGVA